MKSPSSGSRSWVAGLLVAVVSSGADGQLRAQDPGERVPPASIGPGVVETMATVVERDRHAAPVDGTTGVGRWVVPPERLATGAKSGTRHLANRWGDLRMGIAFGTAVAFDGAWFAGYGPEQSWAPAIRFVGFRDGAEVERTAWLAPLAAAPRWLGAGFAAVDRIVVEARPAVDESAWYALDDLTFTAGGTRRVLDFEDLPWRATVSGSGYGGLTWESGARSGTASAGGERVGAVDAPGDARRAVAVAGSATGGAEVLLTGARSPHVTRSFQGAVLFDPGGGWVPPDSCGAVGLDHFVSIVNANLSVWTKATGQRLLNVSIASFWGATAVGDPRMVFDPHSQRFFASAMDGPQGNVYLAVSTTSDPTGPWFKFSFVAGRSGLWADFPRLGVDARGVYVSALIVGSDSSTLWALDKAPLVGAIPSVGTITAWQNLAWEGGPQPCVTYGDPGVEYVISEISGRGLRVRAVQPPLTTPTLVQIGAQYVVTNTGPPPTPALGSAVPLSSGDSRLANAVFRHGSIWTAQGVDEAGRAAFRWYEVQPSSTRPPIVQWGTIADPVRSFIYPSIAVNALGDVVLGFSGAHAGEYAGCWVTGRMAGDPLGTMAAPELLHTGEGPYQHLDGNGTNRFGDYSMTSVDPGDELAFWTIQEYAGAGNLWKTRIARVEYDWSEYGDGHAGTLGVPQISLIGRPAMGGTVVLNSTNSVGAPTPGAVLLGAQAAATPVLGGTLLVAPLITIDAVLPPPVWLTQLAIPNDPGLLRRSVFLQVFEIDSGAAQGVAFTPGIELRIGR